MSQPRPFCIVQYISEAAQAAGEGSRKKKKAWFNPFLTGFLYI